MGSGQELHNTTGLKRGDIVIANQRPQCPVRDRLTGQDFEPGRFATARQREDALGSIGRRAWASSLAKVRDYYGDKEKNRAGDEYPRHYVGAGSAADRKELTGDDQRTSNRDPDNSGLVGCPTVRAMTGTLSGRVCDVVSHAPNAPVSRSFPNGASAWRGGQRALGVALTDDFSAPCWSVQRIPTHGRLAPCAN